MAASDAYMEATMTRREDVLGRHMFDVFPDNPDEADATGVNNLGQSFDKVLRSLTSHRGRLYSKDGESKVHP